MSFLARLRFVVSGPPVIAALDVAADAGNYPGVLDDRQDAIRKGTTVLRFRE